MLDTEDSDNQVFLEFIEFVNKMAHFSSTEGTDGLGFSSGSSGIFNFICGLDNGVKDLEGFLDEAGIKTALVERDITGEKLFIVRWQTRKFLLKKCYQVVWKHLSFYISGMCREKIFPLFLLIVLMLFIIRFYPGLLSENWQQKEIYK